MVQSSSKNIQYGKRHQQIAFVAICAVVAFILSATHAVSARADDKDSTLVFRENIEKAPYIYRMKGSNTKLPQGYIPALLKYFMDDHDVDLDFLIVPRNRVPSSFAQQKLDVALLSEKWIENPEDFTFSQPIARYRTVLVGEADSKNEISFNISELKSAYICAHRGYVYPELDKYWESNNLIRVDFADELLQLKGLQADRCQYAIVEEAVASWYIKRHFKGQRMAIVAEENTVPLTLAFRKDKAEYAAMFDSTISRLKANGELNILQRVFGVAGY
ncbi:MAG: transporter substrate-binding domain-containing protein [Pseudomonadales bacterium]|nr:transporter substrate-binding domain-containing protein [Pseudomonadales bacterium]